MRRTVKAAVLAVSLAAACVGPPPTPCTECEGKCVDVQTDPKNCGACGKQCGPGSQCQEGACTSCPAGTTVCNGRCVNQTNDPTNCGACGTQCAADQFCRASMCVPECPAPLSVCSGACIDLQTSSQYCGACTISCTSAEHCANGACARNCSGTLTSCNVADGGFICADLGADNAHCGMCGRACTAGPNAIAAQCSPTGCEQECEPGTVDLDRDATNGCESLSTGGMLLWLRPETLSALPDDAGVNTWPDSSATKLPVNVAPTSSGPPRVVRNVRNGNAAVVFNAAQYFLTAPVRLFEPDQEALTVFLAVRPELDTQRFVMMQRAVNCQSNFELGFRTGTTTRNNWGVHNGCGNATVSEKNVAPEWQVLTTEVRPGRPPSNVVLYRDGVGVTGVNDATGFREVRSDNMVERHVVIGARETPAGTFEAGFNGELGELIVFKRALSLRERQSVERYLMAKWGLGPKAKTASGEIELLEQGPSGGGGDTVLLQATQADGGTMSVRAAQSRGFVFPEEPAAVPNVRVMTSPGPPWPQNCRVTVPGTTRADGDFDGTLVTCGFARTLPGRSLGPAMETTTSSTTYEGIPLFQTPIRFTTLRVEQSVLVALSLPYLSGQGAQNVLAEALAGIEVDGVVVAEAMNQAAFWGQGGPVSVSTIVKVKPGRHVVRPVWKVGAVPNPNGVPNVRLADSVWAPQQQGQLTAVVLDSFASFRGAVVTESAEPATVSGTMYLPVLPPATLTLGSMSKVLAGVMFPAVANTVNQTAAVRMDFGATPGISTGSTRHESAKKSASLWHLGTAPSGMLTVNGLMAPGGGGVAAAAGGYKRRAFAMAFDSSAPSLSLTTGGGVQCTGGQVSIFGGGPMNLNLTRGGMAIAVSTFDAVYSTGNGNIGDLEVFAGPSVGTMMFQSQNGQLSQPASTVWAGYLAQGGHGVHAVMTARPAGIGNQACVTLPGAVHVIALE